MTSTLTLTIASGDVSVPSPDPADPATQVWYAPDGEPSAYFYLVGDEYWANLPGIGAYRVVEGADVVVSPDPSAPYKLVVDAYRRTVLPQALQFFGREVLHASAVVGPAGVVGFSAYSQTGKSTVAFALAKRGYRPWADDALLFETTEQGAVTHALPFTIRLRPGSREYFDVEPLPPEEQPSGGTVTVGAESLPLAALCVLSRDAEGDTAREPAVEHLGPSEAVSALLPHAYWVSLTDETRKSRMLRAYLQLAAAVPVYSVSIPASLDQLPTVLAAVEDTVLRAGGAQ
jgi:hypothetical protein